jgi:hypothetical protein
MALRPAKGTLQQRLERIETLLFRHVIDLDERDAEDWIAYGFEPDDVEILLACGVTSPHAAAVIEDEGLSPQKFAERCEKRAAGDEPRS